MLTLAAMWVLYELYSVTCASDSICLNAVYENNRRSDLCSTLHAAPNPLLFLKAVIVWGTFLAQGLVQVKESCCGGVTSHMLLCRHAASVAGCSGWFLGADSH